MDPPVVLVGCTTNRSLFGGPARTVNGVVSTGERASPAVAVAVRETLDSAVVYVTPEMTTLSWPAAMIPVSVPPNVPVPVFFVSVIVVGAATFDGRLEPSRLNTVTLNPTPACGSVPEFTLLMASLVAACEYAVPPPSAQSAIRPIITLRTDFVMVSITSRNNLRVLCRGGGG